MTMNESHEKNIYLHIADVLRNEIVAGLYADKIPGLREISQRFSANIKTASKSISLLIEEGLLYQVRGKGTFIVSERMRDRYTKIGLVLPDIVNPNFSSFLHDFQEIAFCSRKSVNINTNYNNPENLSSIISSYKQNGIKLIVIHEGAIRDSDSRELVLNCGIPLIGVNTHMPGIDDVWLDMIEGAEIATTHLINNYPGPVAFISGSDSPLKETSRYKGYEKALTEGDIEIYTDYLVSTSPTYSGGYHGTMKLIKKEKLPRSIFYYNQIMALGGVNALAGTSINIPEEIAIIACDDSIDEKEMLVPVSSIRFSNRERAKVLVKLIERRLRGPGSRPESVKISPELIIRDSSRIVPGAALP